MESDSTEIYVKAPWGNIAVVSWYEGSSEPVLMVHGRQDSAATFVPLVSHLPRTRQYVAVDLPGNGRSDSFPKGIMIQRYHFIAVIDYVIKHFGWKSCVYLAHSMGCEIGLFYNAVWPGVISRFVHLDAGPSFQRLQQSYNDYERHFHNYYSNYRRYNSDDSKVYTRRKALDAVMRARKMNEEQAAVILSRVLVKIGEDRYRMSWDPRMKTIVPQNLTNEGNIKLFTRDKIPSLLITMSEGHGGNLRGKDGADQLIRAMMEADNFREVVLSGQHDYHVTHAEEVAKYVVDFLDNKSCDIKCKI
ncbi:unnamed protein product [Chilo suppressalis]|uniref:AB hydrolase-1 domain-containing protein n=1 Tax=Chilo suppressalis TaxID=168631 RepID=A0ABN8L5N7_CHISP|nr:unnamed protein product [Chilo suppressalis]